MEGVEHLREGLCVETLFDLVTDLRGKEKGKKKKSNGAK